MDTPEKSNKDAAQWWNLLKEVRYPLLAGHMFPKLPISGSPEDHLSDLDQETISESPAIRQLLRMRRSMRLEFVF